MRRLLLGQLGANGDVLYTTILARQIKHDHPGAHLTWAVSTQCAGLLRNNPHVDALWEVPVAAWEDHKLMWRVFEREATRRLLAHEFDHAWLSQVWPNNFRHYDGTIRSSILRAYGKPVTVPIENVIALADDELERVGRWAREQGLAQFAHRILFECSSKSGQSFVNPDVAQAVADRVYAQLPDATVIFCTNLPMTLRHRNSRYCASLSLREVAGLTHHCTFFAGTGSGATVAATSTAAQRLPNLQVLSASTSVYASFLHDFEYFGLPHDHMAEMTREDPAEIAAAMVLGCTAGMAAVRERYGAKIEVRFDHYFEMIRGHLLKLGRYLDAAQSLEVTAERYGWRPELRQWGRDRIAPNLDLDPGWLHAGRRAAAAAFLAKLEAA